MSGETESRDVGPGALDEHLPIPSTRVAVVALLTRDSASIALTVAALTAATVLLELLGAFGAGLALGLVAAFALAVVRSAAHGAPRLPDAADFTGLESWLVPLAQVGLALLPSAALVAWTTRRSRRGSCSRRWRSSPSFDGLGRDGWAQVDSEVARR